MPVNYKNYHPSWKQISLFVRRLKALNRCEKCHLLNYSVIRRTNIVERKESGSQLEIYSQLGEMTYKKSKAVADALNSDADNLGKWVVVVLTVAHLDHDTTNNELSNLEALCQKCHNCHDTEHRKANRKKNKK